MKDYYEGAKTFYLFEGKGLTMPYFDSTFEDKKNISFLKTDKPVRLGEVIKYGNELYSVGSAHKVKDEVCLNVHEVKFQDEPEELCENEVTCPYCKCNYESFEMEDSDKNFHCENCGSTFSYHREITVDYWCSPVGKNEKYIEV